MQMDIHTVERRRIANIKDASQDIMSRTLGVNHYHYYLIQVEATMRPA